MHLCNVWVYNMTEANKEFKEYPIRLSARTLGFHPSKRSSTLLWGAIMFLFETVNHSSVGQSAGKLNPVFCVGSNPTVNYSKQFLKRL